MNESSRARYNADSPEVVFLRTLAGRKQSRNDKAMIGNIINMLMLAQNDKQIIADAMATNDKARMELADMRKELRVFKLVAQLADYSLSNDRF
jgi:hypothetical protein